MRTRHSLTSADVQKIMAGAKAEAEKNGWKVTIAVVDDAGVPLILERMDGAARTTADVAVGKARSSAITGRPSLFWEERIKERPAFLNFPGILPIQGAVPIIHEGECVGAVGVSGVASQDDEKIASAGAAALG
jgi:glc operon protein GlcG